MRYRLFNSHLPNPKLSDNHHTLVQKTPQGFNIPLWGEVHISVVSGLCYCVQDNARSLLSPYWLATDEELRNLFTDVHVIRNSSFLRSQDWFINIDGHIETPLGTIVLKLRQDNNELLLTMFARSDKTGSERIFNKNMFSKFQPYGTHGPATWFDIALARMVEWLSIVAIGDNDIRISEISKGLNHGAGVVELYDGKISYGVTWMPVFSSEVSKNMFLLDNADV